MPTLASLVEETARTCPGAVAVAGPDSALTYQELISQARDLAQEISVTGASTVAVTGLRGPGLVVAVVATVLADVRLVLVDPELPEPRRATMLTESSAELLVALSGAGRAEISRLASVPGAAAPGYVFFTSGTTARPKAVVGHWAGIAHFVEWQRDTFGITEGDRFAQLTAPSFDVVLRDLFTPLSAGATICVPPADVATRTGGVMGWLKNAGITAVHTVPSLAARWAAAGPATVGSELRLTFFAGEPLPAAAVEQWRQCFDRTRVVNLYGPTETTLAKFWHDVTTPVPGVQPVGRPLPDTELRLVDDEVWISTAYATTGYLNAPDEQRARFVTDPADGTGPGVRTWYRTGDLGHLGAGGELHLRGRADFQVKVNGNRVEPEGIAAVLREHPAAHHAVVVARPRSDGALYLAGFYAAAAGTADEPDIRSWLGERLPAAQVPSVLRRLDELPLTANGKVDRDALPAPAALSAEDASGGPGAVTAFEQTVLDVFRTVLVDAPARVDADFFDYGGTSLDAAGLSVRLLSATGRRVEMSEIYRLRTPHAVAGALRDRPLDGQDAIPHGEQPSSTGLSPQQRRYRHVYLPRVNRSWSNMPALFTLPAGTGTVDVQRALLAVLRRHDGLRAYFSQPDAEPDAGRDGVAELRQHFAPDDALPVAVDTTDLRSLPDQDQNRRMEELRIAEADSPIDITRAPLFRARLLLHHAERATLLWNVHHMVSDGYSQRLLHQELTLLLNGAPEELPSLPISYRDYIGWRAAACEAEPYRSYWQQVFAEPYVRPLLLELPVDAEPARGIAYQFPVSPELREEVGSFCRSHGVTAFSVYFAAYALMAHDLFNRDDLVIGTPAAGRTRPEFEHLIGNFISLVGIRHQRGEEAGFSELVRLLQERTVLAMENQDYQYDQIMTDIGAVPDDDRFPLTTVFLSLVETPKEQAAALRTSLHRDLGCEVKFDLMGYLKRAGDMIALELHTRQGLLSPGRLEELEASFLGFLRHGLKES